jgi:hypothetical protein
MKAQLRGDRACPRARARAALPRRAPAPLSGT